MSQLVNDFLDFTFINSIALNVAVNVKSRPHCCLSHCFTVPLFCIVVIHTFIQ